MKNNKILKVIGIAFLLAIFVLPLSIDFPQANAAKPLPTLPITVTSPSPAYYAQFGQSVATDGSYVIVGAYAQSPGNVSYAGNAYVFRINGTYIATLASQSPENYGNFGWSVAIAGGYVVVGAPGETSNSTNLAGNAYVFRTNGTYVAALTSPNAQEDGRFGWSVAISGGYVIVGAPYESSGGQSSAGNAYVFRTNGTYVATLTSPNTQVDGDFGQSVATDGTTVVIGAQYETSNGQSLAGNAYVFSTVGTLIANLTSPNAQVSGFFGHSVAISGRYLVVGAPSETTGSTTGGGNVYIFTLGKSVRLSKTLSSPNPQAYGSFGDSIAISGRGIIIGAYAESSGAVYHAGNAYVFTTAGKLTSTLTSVTPTSQGRFGNSVAIGGNYALVGAPFESSSGQGSAGNAYIFQLS